MLTTEVITRGLLSSCCRVFRTQYSTESLPVITLPLPLKRRLKDVQHKKREQERKRIKVASRQGNALYPVIVGKNERLNHYRGQMYDKFQPIPLASKGWKHRRTAGDHFTIQAHDSNPAIQWFGDDEESPQDFRQFHFSEELTRGIEELGLRKPTNIQRLAIPPLLAGRHVVCAAETGSGKTVAYLTPLIENILKYKRIHTDAEFNQPKALILAPSYELVHQIGMVAKTLSRSVSLKTKILAGGRGAGTKALLNPDVSEVDIMVATLSLLKRLVHEGVYKVDRVKHVVIDEADTMTDDSFNEALLKFLKRFSFLETATGKTETQLCLIGATLPRDLHNILKAAIDTETMVRVTTPNVHRLMPHVPQKFVRVKSSQKPVKLLELVKSDVKKKKAVIIFSKDRATSDYVSIFLEDNGVPNVNLNGEMSMRLRAGRFDKFQRGEVNVISCTDVGSRGLDTIRVQHVINYDFPSFMSDYIHRVGRTGRVGSKASGHVTSFVAYAYEAELLQKIETAARMTDSLPNVNANIKRKLGGSEAPSVTDDEQPVVIEEDDDDNNAWQRL